MQSNTIVFRADKTTLDKIKKTAKDQGVSHAHVIRDALALYYNPLQMNTAPNTGTYDREMVDLLKNQVIDLQNQRDQLQLRIDYYSQPWYWRIFNRPMQHQLPAGKREP